MDEPQHNIDKNIFTHYLNILKNKNLTEENILEITKNISKFSNIIDDKSYIKYDNDKVKDIYNNLLENSKLVIDDSVTVTMTTCKRYDLFEQTINSFIQCCKDINKFVYEWIVVDDNSTEEDRQKMIKNYPFIKFYLKTDSQKGHAISMNILLKLIKTPYIFHIEDDWRFFHQDNYLEKCITVLKKNEKYGQCLLNRGYSEDLEKGNLIAGGYKRYAGINNDIRYYIHEHIVGPSLNKCHEEISKLGYTSCIYWPHYSLRVGMTKKSVYDNIGLFDIRAKHFEMEYANRYITYKFITTYLDNTFCTHIGRKTYERDSDKLNAYDLNKEKQFGSEPKPQINNIKENNITSRDDIILFFKRISINILNLERRPDRLEMFTKNNTKELQNINFNVFSAIDGQLLTPNQRIQKLFLNNDYNYRKGIIGCALSHIKIWLDSLINPDIDGIIVLEDDAELTNNFIEKCYHCINISSDADIIFLSHHPYPQYKLTENFDKNRFPTTEKWDLDRCKKESMGGTTGYYISKRGMLNMINHLNKKGLVNAIDWEMFKTANINNIYYCSPYLVFADCTTNDNKVDSDIQYDFTGVGFLSDNDKILAEIKYWNETGVKNIFQELSVPLDEKSKIVCRDINDSKDILKTISIMRNTDEIKHKFWLHPLWWYEIDPYIVLVPETMISLNILSEKTLFNNFVNQNSFIP